MGCILSWNKVLQAPDSSKSSRKFRKNELALAKKYLSTFGIYETSTDADRQIVAQFWKEIFYNVGNSERSGRSFNYSRGRVDASSGQNSLNSSTTATTNLQQSSPISQLYAAFYMHLEVHAPHLLPVFRASMHVRSKVLVHISAGLQSLLVSDRMSERLMTITRTHFRYGVCMDHYEPLGQALFHTMAVIAGPLWSKNIEMAWKRLFVHCAVILLLQHKKVLDEQTKQRKAAQLSPMINDVYTAPGNLSIRESKHER